MSRATLIITASVAALVLSAMATASASAEWFINGAKLPTGSKAALATKAVVQEPAILNVPGLALKVSCPALSAVKPELIGTTKGRANSLIFEGCSEIEPKTCKISPATIEIEPKTCKISPATIETEPVAILTHESFSLFGWEIWLTHAEESTLVATLTFTGTCSFAGEQPVRGTLALGLPALKTENPAQLLEGIGSIENNSLEIAKNKAFIEKGKILLKLASASKWSFQ